MSVGMLAVAHEPASAALVRRSIADDLSCSLTRDSIDDVVLVASELVGNALVHTAARDEDELDVTWVLERDAVVVQVLDSSSSMPQPRSSDATTTGGRGLAIVAAIAHDWGVRRNAHGKQVWARVPVDRR